MSISLLAKVQETVNAIDEEGLRPVVDEDVGRDIYVLNTRLKNLGNIIYTVFDRETLDPVASYSVRYGHQHVIAEVLFQLSSLRFKLPEIEDTEIPGVVKEEFDPTIIPGCSAAYPTAVSETQGTPKFIQGT